MINHNKMQGFLEGKTPLHEIREIRNELLKDTYPGSFTEMIVAFKKGRESIKETLQDMFIEHIPDWVVNEVVENCKHYGIVYAVFLYQENQKNRRNRIKILLTLGESSILEYEECVKFA